MQMANGIMKEAIQEFNHKDNSMNKKTESCKCCVSFFVLGKKLHIDFILVWTLQRIDWKRTEHKRKATQLQQQQQQRKKKLINLASVVLT
jgi:hypothetical protein